MSVYEAAVRSRVRRLEWSVDSRRAIAATEAVAALRDSVIRSAV
jgi:hypothetical protein